MTKYCWKDIDWRTEEESQSSNTKPVILFMAFKSIKTVFFIGQVASFCFDITIDEWSPIVDPSIIDILDCNSCDCPGKELIHKQKIWVYISSPKSNICFGIFGKQCKTFFQATGTGTWNFKLESFHNTPDFYSYLKIYGRYGPPKQVFCGTPCTTLYLTELDTAVL